MCSKVTSKSISLIKMIIELSAVCREISYNWVKCVVCEKRLSNSAAVHDPLRFPRPPPAQNLGVATPQPSLQDWRLCFKASWRPFAQPVRLSCSRRHPCSKLSAFEAMHLSAGWGWSRDAWGWRRLVEISAPGNNYYHRLPIKRRRSNMVCCI